MAEEIDLYRRIVKYRFVRANKRRKGKFAEVIRDVFNKRPKIFISSRTIKVSALSFSEYLATITSIMIISKWDKHYIFLELQKNTLHGTRNLRIFFFCCC